MGSMSLAYGLEMVRGVNSTEAGGESDTTLAWAWSRTRKWAFAKEEHWVDHQSNKRTGERLRPKITVNDTRGD